MSSTTASRLGRAISCSAVTRGAGAVRPCGRATAMASNRIGRFAARLMASASSTRRVASAPPTWPRPNMPIRKGARSIFRNGSMAAMTPGIIERYAASLPVTATTPRITLGEGAAPLVRSSRLGPPVGLHQLYFKYEGLNPSGSFKDRGMALATAKAVEAGAKTLLCASTGNTSASASAYAARCGLRAVVVVPAGGIAAGKLAQALAYGATVLTIKGSFDTALKLVRQLADQSGVALVNSVNPDRIEGQKTAAFEIVEQLREVPAELFIRWAKAAT